MRFPTLYLTLLAAFITLLILSPTHAQTAPDPSSKASSKAPETVAEVAEVAAEPPPPTPTPSHAPPPASTRTATEPAPIASATTAPTPSPQPSGLNLGLGPSPSTVVRDTPRATLQGFFEASQRQDFDTAAHFVHLWGITPGTQKKKGPELASKLATILERAVWIDLDQVPDTPTGSTTEGAKSLDELKITSIDLPKGSHSIRLSRMRDPFSNSMVWVFSANTVRNIDMLDEVYGLPEFVEKLPTWTKEHKVLGLLGFQWFGLLLFGVLAWIIGAIVEFPAVWTLRRLIRRLKPQREDDAAVLTHGLLRWLVSFGLFLASYPLLRLSATTSQYISQIITTGIIIIGMVGAMRFIRLTVEAVQRHQSQIDDASRLRTLMTRLDALRRVAQVLVIIVGIALALMQFPTARTVGLSLLGSAGIAGAILGFAAQKTFSNIFAGLLISFTQPIRIGDIVNVENETGTIEEILSTHVVVRIWDGRRLIIPVTYFLESPFQNWTRTTPELAGTVFLHVDYRINVDEVRERLDEILKDEPLFNGKAKGVLVVDMTERSALLRVTVSANDSSSLWDLRCKVREKLLAYLQSEPGRLPRQRMEGSFDSMAI